MIYGCMMYQAITYHFNIAPEYQMPFPDRSFQLSLNPHLSKVYDLLLDCLVLGFVFPTGTVAAKSISQENSAGYAPT